MKSRLVAGAALLILGAANAAADETVVLDERLAIARPLLVIPPPFPDSAKALATPVEVRVRGRVSIDGRLLEPIVTTTIGNEAFIGVVSSVVSEWRFVPAIGADCRPVEREDIVYVWFETKGGAPSVSVSIPAEKERHSPNWTRVKDEKPLVRKAQPRLEYPDRMLRAGIEGTAVVLLKIARSGEIVESRLRAVSPVDEFAYPALHGLQRMSFEPFETDPPGRDVICAEYTLNYCMTFRDAKVPHPSCEAKRKAR